VNVFKTALLGATFLVGAASVASAADVYQRGSYKDAPEAYMPAVTWTGFYVGANIGSTFNDTTTVEFLSVEIAELEYDNSLVGGIQVGYNYQTPRNVVFGIEADIGILDDEGVLFDEVTSYLASVRGKLGYSFGKTMVYGTAGLAIQGLQDDISDFVEDDTALGWVAGGGIEYKLFNNVSLGAEALYYQFENEALLDLVDLDREFWTVRAKLNYHFTSAYEEPLK
jgi:outer membrane immunogenic protein